MTKRAHQRRWALAQSREKDGTLHAFSIADGGTRTTAVCREAYRYFSQMAGSIGHLEDKPENMCQVCKERIEEEPPVGTPEWRAWIDSDRDWSLL